MPTSTAGTSSISRRQLRAVFELCDPHGTGFVSLEHLLQLGRDHCGGDRREDVERVLLQLDPHGRGLIGFPDFCRGVTAVLNAGGNETMMAPAVYQQPPPVPPSFVLTSTTSMEDAAIADDTDSALGGSASPDLNGKSGQENLPNRRWGSFRHSGKRLGSNALASQLYRSSSFNSSGRSSTCDTADDMYSDVSLEEDVLDLNHKVQMLQQQVSVLADNQNNTDDRYTRAKQDSAALQARVHMLEEQLRECELRADERLQEEQRRNREMMVRVEREKQLQIENCSIRLQTLELEAASLREEASRLRTQVDRLRGEKQMLEDQLGEAEAMLAALRDETQALREMERRSKDEVVRERAANSQLVDELSREVERLSREQPAVCSSAEIPSNEHSRLQEELTRLRQENKSLQESNEELQAQMLTRSLEEGRTLLTGTSLAQEFEAMSKDELRDNTLDHLSLDKMRTALKEQQEVNAQLRSYIDGILLNIVDNYPQLLEVKTN